MDVSEVLPAPETGGLGFDQHGITGGVVPSPEKGGTLRDTGADIWASTGGAGSPARLKDLLKAKKTKPAMNNRKLQLMMSTKKKKKAGAQTGGKAAGDKKTGKARTGKPPSALATLKAEAAAGLEGGVVGTGLGPEV